MRLVDSVRPIRTAVVLACAAWLAVAAQASALTVASPTEGQIVRDQVAIVIPKSSLPSDVASSGFVVIKIDGRFCAAVGASESTSTSKAPARPSIVYVWDTKAPINDPALPEDNRHYRDGRHEIVVEAHGMDGRKDSVAGTATVNVNLQNQIPRPNPAPPIKLTYRYILGQQTKYKVTVSGEVLNSTGLSLTGGQAPVFAEFVVDQDVEDARPGGSALLRYKVEKDNGFAQIFGQASLLGQTGQPFRSVYKILSSAGETLDANVLSTRSDIQVTDCLLTLPGRPVQVGEAWRTTYHLKLEGLSDTMDFTGTSTLNDLEWEGGWECAKISTTLSGSPTFKFLPQGSAIGALNVTNTAYFAYKRGKLLKDTTLIEFSTTLDDAVLANLQAQTAVPTASGTAGAVPAMVIPGMPTVPGATGTSYPVPATPTSYPVPTGGPTTDVVSSGAETTTGAATTSATPKTAVKFRLVVTKQLER